MGQGEGEKVRGEQEAEVAETCAGKQKRGEAGRGKPLSPGVRKGEKSPVLGSRRLSYQQRQCLGSRGCSWARDGKGLAICT